jgi:hypothetical protein
MEVKRRTKSGQKEVIRRKIGCRREECTEVYCIALLRKVTVVVVKIIMSPRTVPL